MKNHEESMQATKYSYNNDNKWNHMSNIIMKINDYKYNY